MKYYTVREPIKHTLVFEAEDIEDMLKKYIKKKFNITDFKFSAKDKNQIVVTWFTT